MRSCSNVSRNSTAVRFFEITQLTPACRAIVPAWGYRELVRRTTGISSARSTTTRRSSRNPAEARAEEQTMRFGLRAAIVLSASAGVSASAITCSVGQLFMRRRSPARTTTSSSTSKTPVCETEVEVAIVVLCVFKIVRDGILSERIFQRRVRIFRTPARRGENALPPFQAHSWFQGTLRHATCGPYKLPYHTDSGHRTMCLFLNGLKLDRKSTRLNS